MKTFRANSLDTLRGITIGMMVLCGTIINWALPHWMSHCQVPPRVGFDPSIYGITWVDLVFPFFLFSMGAAMPFSVGSRLERGASRCKVVIDAIWRGLKLAFFAIFIQNCYPWVLSGSLGHPQDPQIWCITIGAFLVLFLLFSRWPGKPGKLVRYGLPALGFMIACALMGWIESHVTLSDEFMATGPSASAIFFKHLDHILYNSNIIILLLGNMAAFGTIIYIITLGRPLARLAILPFLMGLLLGGSTGGTWQAAVFNWSPAPWLYQFVYLKYLFIIIPGTIAGEYLRRWILDGGIRPAANPAAVYRQGFSTALVALLSLAIIVINVWLLYTRDLTPNLWITFALVVLIFWFARRLPANLSVVMPLVKFAIYMLLLGLFFEAFQGGIRKDDPTFSYYFVTSGLATFALVFLVIICDVYRWKFITTPFTLAGKNPMIAYVASSMFFFPISNLLGCGDSAIPFWESTWLWAIMRGVLYTSLAIGLAAFFSKIRLFWRT